VHLLVNN